MVTIDTYNPKETQYVFKNTQVHDDITCHAPPGIFSTDHL